MCYLCPHAYLMQCLSSCSECQSEVERKQSPLKTNYNYMLCLRTKRNQDASPALFLFFSAGLVTVREKAASPGWIQTLKDLLTHRNNLKQLLYKRYFVLFCSVLTSASLNGYFGLFLQVEKLLNAN